MAERKERKVQIEQIERRKEVEAGGWEQWRAALPKLDRNAARQAQARWDAVAKPLDGLGRLERIVTRIAGMRGDAEVVCDPATLLVLCADNGIVAEGVSQSGQEVTAAVARSLAAGRSSVCRMAGEAGVRVVPVDLGIAEELAEPGLLSRRVRRGTESFLRGSAMTEAEALAAIRIGIRLAGECAERGDRLLLTGEMGIGNTTTSAALTAALLGRGAAEVCGRGAGLDDAGLARKREVIANGLALHGCGKTPVTEPEDVLRVLAALGGLDIAGLAGVCIGGALYRIPVVLDGVITAAAALVAERLVPGCRGYLLASHSGREPAMRYLLAELQLDAVIDAQLALGEGTGAVLLPPLLRMALAVYHTKTSFAELELEPYRRYEESAEGGV